MTKKEFYDIMEMFGAYASIPPKTHAMMEMLEMYPNLKSMTCEDALEWLENRGFEWYKKLQEEMVDEKKVWHDGFDENDKPQIYVEPTTGAKWTTYALCICWYDGWICDLCKVTDDGMFLSMTNEEHTIYEPKFFEYWAYTDDLIPSNLYNDLIPDNCCNGKEEGNRND